MAAGVPEDAERAAPRRTQPGPQGGGLRLSPAGVARVAYGEPALALLADRVRDAKGGDPLAPLTVVVAGNYAAVATGLALARRGGVAGTAFVTLHRLAERIAGPTLAAAGRRPVSAALILHGPTTAMNNEHIMQIRPDQPGQERP